VLWHDGTEYVFRNLQDIRRDRQPFSWNFRCSAGSGLSVDVVVDGAGSSAHRLPYLKTNCSGSFEVINNSLSKATLRLEHPGAPVEGLETSAGAVLEMAG
jgi:hypothetical protein